MRSIDSRPPGSKPIAPPASQSAPAVDAPTDPRPKALENPSVSLAPLTSIPARVSASVPQPTAVLAPGWLQPAVAAVLAGASFFALPYGALADARTSHGLASASALQQTNDRALVTAQAPALERGARGIAVRVLQELLASLGYPVGEIDEVFGPMVRGAVISFQLAHGLPANGQVTAEVWQILSSGQAKRMPSPARFAPFSQEAIALFERAAALIGVPASWASSPSLHHILSRESDGIVGRPNYTYGRGSRNAAHWPAIHAELKAGIITARSSATGLGQLLLDNVERHYPSGRKGIGDALEEAAGMLSYIRERYGSPERAWALYGKRHEGY